MACQEEGGCVRKFGGMYSVGQGGEKCSLQHGQRELKTGCSPGGDNTPLLGRRGGHRVHGGGGGGKRYKTPMLPRKDVDGGSKKKEKFVRTG